MYSTRVAAKVPVSWKNQAADQMQVMANTIQTLRKVILTYYNTTLSMEYLSLVIPVKILHVYIVIHTLNVQTLYVQMLWDIHYVGG